MQGPFSRGYPQHSQPQGSREPQSAPTARPCSTSNAAMPQHRGSRHQATQTSSRLVPQCRLGPDPSPTPALQLCCSRKLRGAEQMGREALLPSSPSSQPGNGGCPLPSGWEQGLHSPALGHFHLNGRKGLGHPQWGCRWQSLELDRGEQRCAGPGRLGRQRPSPGGRGGGPARGRPRVARCTPWVATLPRQAAPGWRGPQARSTAQGPPLCPGHRAPRSSLLALP